MRLRLTYKTDYTISVVGVGSHGGLPSRILAARLRADSKFQRGAAITPDRDIEVSSEVDNAYRRLPSQRARPRAL